MRSSGNDGFNEYLIRERFDSVHRLCKWGYIFLGVMFIAIPIMIGLYIPDRDLGEIIGTVLLFLIFGAAFAFHKYIGASEQAATLEVAQLLRDSGYKGDVLEEAERYRVRLRTHNR
jgi:hypothetical protein